MAIRREIYVTQKRLDICIDMAHETDILPIVLNVVDYEVPEGAIATAYSIGKENQIQKKLCDISENEIAFTPPKGFFDKGENALQIRVTYDNRDLFSYKMTVRCHENIADDDAQEVESQPTLVTQLLTEVANTKGYVNEALLEVERPNIDSSYNGVATERIEPVLPINKGDSLKNILSILTQVANNEEYNYNLIQLLIDQRSHIGSIVQSTTLDTEEKVINLYGGTRWELIRGRFLLGESDGYPIGTIGGKDVYKLTAAIGACNGNSSSIGYVAADYSAYQAGVGANYVISAPATTYGHWSHGTPVTDASSSSRDTTIVPPYKTVYIWERVE